MAKWYAFTGLPATSPARRIYQHTASDLRVILEVRAAHPQVVLYTANTRAHARRIVANDVQAKATAKFADNDAMKAALAVFSGNATIAAHEEEE